MSENSSALKQIRLKPTVHEKLLAEQKNFPIRISIWELANAAIDCGLSQVRGSMFKPAPAPKPPTAFQRLMSASTPVKPVTSTNKTNA